MNSLQILRAANLRAPHGFLGRRGGASAGEFASMNLADWVGDDSRCVARNLEIARAGVPELLDFARVRQVHGAKVVEITRKNFLDKPQADGMVTSERAIALAVFSADCVPIIIADAKTGAVAALHAGWRGVLANIASAGIAALEAIGARRENLHVAMGPAIDLCCFEVDRSLADNFCAAIPVSQNFRRDTKPGKANIDLRAIIHTQLSDAGVPDANIESVGPCTKCSASEFFSRRAARGATTGLNTSFISVAN